MTGLDLLHRLDACEPALAWAAGYRGRPASEAWAECEHGDWLLWIAARLHVDRRLVVLAACDCARLALVHVPAGDLRPLRAIETAEAWCRGEATLDEVRASAAAARAAESAWVARAAEAAWAAEAARAARAAEAAVEAARAAVAAARAAEWSVWAAEEAAARAAEAAVWAAEAARAAEAAARAAALAQCADLVRARIPWALIEARVVEVPRG